MVVLKKNHQKLFQFVSVASLILISFGFFALWRQEQMLQKWTAAEGTAVHLEITESIDPSLITIDNVDVVFNYMADNRVYQGKVKFLLLEKVVLSLHSSFDTEDLNIIDLLTPAIQFFLNADAGSGYDFGNDQIMHVRSFNGKRQMRIPFNLAPRLPLYHHETSPERYRLNTSYLSMTSFYGAGFIISLVSVIVLCFLFYFQDRKSIRVG